MKDTKTLAVLATGCLLAGIAPFIVPAAALRTLAVAATFAFPAVFPFFFKDRGFGLAAAVVSLGLVAFGSFTGAPLVSPVTLRRTLLIRNLQFASVGALAGALVVGCAWIEDLAMGRVESEDDL